jgi:peptidoglycan hydrolase CwlO-like protein
MSALSDAIAAAQQSMADFDTALTDLETRVSADLPALQKHIDDLTAQVAALQAQIDAGNTDPALVDAVNQLKTQIDAAKVRLPNIDPAVPSPPPEPTPT